MPIPTKAATASPSESANRFILSPLVWVRFTRVLPLLSHPSALREVATAAEAIVAAFADPADRGSIA